MAAVRRYGRIEMLTCIL